MSVGSVLTFLNVWCNNDHSVNNVLNDNPAFKVECIFVSAPSHQDGDQEAEIASYLARAESIEYSRLR